MADKITFPIFSVYIKSSKKLLALSGLLIHPSKPFSHLRSFYFKCGFSKSTYILNEKKISVKAIQRQCWLPFFFPFFFFF